MSEENTSDNITYINGQKVYDEDFVEPLVPPMPKSPIELSMEQAAFLSKELATAKSSTKHLVEQNAFISKELAVSQAKNSLLAEQQASILLLLAKQICSHPEENPSDTPVEEDTDAPQDETEESNEENPNEEDAPKEGDSL